MLVNGLLLFIMGAGMLFPAMIEYSFKGADGEVFLFTAGFVMFVGGMFFASNSGVQGDINQKQAFLLTVSMWVVLPIFGALPFVFTSVEMSYTDAFFEAMSGISTTGSTVMTGLDGAPPGILLWRSILQWFGGIGIIVMAVAILPLLQIGGMQLFKVESLDTGDQLLPRAAQLASALSFLYVGLTVLCGVLLWMAGMSSFDAICHAFTTIATGGFSTSDGSIGHYDSAIIDYTVTLFMILGSMPFLIYLRILKGSTGALTEDSQVRWFVTLLLVCIAGITLWLWANGTYDLENSLRFTSFNVVSIITGTGFATTDYTAWGSFAIMGFFFFMFIGGCAGSTSCGIKIFRFQVLCSMFAAHMKTLLRPNGVFIPRYNDNPIEESVMGSVLSYLFLFILCFLLLTVALSLAGLDFITAVSGAGTAMANVGPALGSTIGPAGTFQSLPDTAKWFLTFGMLLGRLELFAVLVLFSPQFWRN
jgi:trk system potassium uptake protein TrkH